MADHARSDDPAVQAQLDRFAQLSPGRDILGLERITVLLEALGNPQARLPPVFHVAGTNGKGSTCAFLRAAIESAGLTVHVYTSPHLVRFNERIRIAGTLITDAVLAPLLAEVLNAAETCDIAPSFFEATTAAALLAFARTPADAAIIEVGLGGRLDATNVIARPAVCGIAQLGVDHEAFLGDDAVVIAGEKAGIAKSGVPLVTMAYPKAQAARVEAIAAEICAPWHPKGDDWDAVVYQDRLHYKDMGGKIDTPLPRLLGKHQTMNAALAIAMIRHQDVIDVPDAAIKAAIGWARWPARMQRLDAGPLTARVPVDVPVWLDGCHNPSGAEVIASFMAENAAATKPLHMVCGILANKDAHGILAPFAPLTPVMHMVMVESHAAHPPEALIDVAHGLDLEAHASPNIGAALAKAASLGAGSILIMGSLYLAAEVLRDNDQTPD
jgi:dihydrofolate synthase / folylpolyglutamate synthase